MNFLMCVRIADLRATLRERRPIACRARLRAWAEFAKKMFSRMAGAPIILIFRQFVNNDSWWFGHLSVFLETGA